MLRSALLTLSLFVCLLSRSALAMSPPTYFNPATDFSITQGNPNGVWTYGWFTNDFKTFTPYTGSELASGMPVWYRTKPASIDLTPCVWLNNTGATHYGVPPNHLSLHPSNGFEPSAVRWTAPVAGYYRVRGRFLPGDSGAMSVAVRYNGQLLWGATDSGAFDFWRTDLVHLVHAGDTFDFVVYGGYGSGNTPLEVEIVRQTPNVPTYDANTEYAADRGNPNGVWTYGWSTTDFSRFTPYDGQLVTSLATQWYRKPASADFTPTIWRNDSTLVRYGVAPGQLSLHPSSSSEPSVLRWTALTSGLYGIYAHFFPGDVGAMKVGVRLNSNRNGSWNSNWLWQADDSGTYSAGQFLEAGDTVDFVVHGGYGSGNTPLDATVQALPWNAIPELYRPTYDGAAQFGTASNPNGAWTYGWMTTRDFTFSPYTGVTPESETTAAAWWRSPASSDFAPLIWRQSPDGGLAYGVAPGEISLHPSAMAEPSVLRFTAPATAQYAIDSTFLAGDVGLVSVGIRQGTSWLWFATDYGTSHLVRSLRAGDSVDFMVFAGYGSGNTPLEVTVHPEVSAPSVKGATASLQADGTCRVVISGRCDGNTWVGPVGQPPPIACRDGHYFLVIAIPGGTSNMSLRGVSAGRPQSLSVPVYLPDCIYK